jgi:capsule polysaccharide export protein KpsE/RkpR
LNSRIFARGVGQRKANGIKSVSNHMENTDMDSTKISPTFSDYLYILLRWKKFIFINVLLVGILTTIAVLLIPTTYKSNAVLMIPPENPFSLSGLMGAKTSGGSISAKLLGISNSSEDVLLGILNSRKTLINTINKFNLMSYYEIKDNNYDKALKAFSADVAFEMNEHSMIEISVINKSPRVSADIANYLAQLLDSLNIKYNLEFAADNRKYIEQRYDKNVADMNSAEEALRAFQKKYGIFSIPQQFEVAIKAAGELEAQLQIKETNYDIARLQYGDGSPQAKIAAQERDIIKQKVMELKNSSAISKESNIFFNFKDVPDVTIEYMKLYRDYEIQQKIMEVILPLYEQAKVEEQKYMPTVAVLDEARVPEIKYSPKRSFIILAIVFLAFFWLVITSFRGEKSLHSEQFKNPVLEKENRFFVATARFFKIQKNK